MLFAARLATLPGATAGLLPAKYFTLLQKCMQLWQVILNCMTYGGGNGRKENVSGKKLQGKLYFVVWNSQPTANKRGYRCTCLINCLHAKELCFKPVVPWPKWYYSYYGIIGSLKICLVLWKKKASVVRSITSSQSSHIILYHVIIDIVI